MAGPVFFDPTEAFDSPSDLSLRFRVQDSVGRSSNTWKVVVHKRTADVYVGVRSGFGIFKLSLHGKTWRLAVVKPGATAPASNDRVLQRWLPAPEIAPGWREAVIIEVPTSGLRTRSEAEREVATIAAAPLGWAQTFHLLLGEPNSKQLGISGWTEVGRLRGGDGGVVWVLVASERCTSERQALHERQRLDWGALAEREGDVFSGFGWLEDCSIPYFLDSG